MLAGYVGALQDVLKCVALMLWAACTPSAVLVSSGCLPHQTGSANLLRYEYSHRDTCCYSPLPRPQWISFRNCQDKLSLKWLQESAEHRRYGLSSMMELLNECRRGISGQSPIMSNLLLPLHYGHCKQTGTTLRETCSVDYILGSISPNPAESSVPSGGRLAAA